MGFQVASALVRTTLYTYRAATGWGDFRHRCGVSLGEQRARHAGSTSYRRTDALLGRARLRILPPDWAAHPKPKRIIGACKTAKPVRLCASFSDTQGLTSHP